jgi:hypothetical protein
MPEGPAAEALYARLARPTAAWQRRLASSWLFAGVSVALALVAWLLLALVASKLDAWLSLRLGARLRDTWSGFSVALFHAGLVLAAAVPWLAVVVSERRAAARAHLRAELAAAPASSPGAARGCRRCAAPLTARAGELGARCSTCGADNLIIGSDGLQRRVASRGAAAVANGDAQLLAAWESVWLRRSLIVRLGLCGLLFLAVAVVQLLTWRTRWASFAEQLHERAVHDAVKLPVRCQAGECTAQLSAMRELPLQKGERLRLGVLAMPDGDELARVTVRHKTSDTRRPRDWPILADSELRAGEELLAQAPFTGWYAWDFVWRRASTDKASLPPSIVEAVVEPVSAP